MIHDKALLTSGHGPDCPRHLEVSCEVHDISVWVHQNLQNMWQMKYIAMHFLATPVVVIEATDLNL